MRYTFIIPALVDEYSGAVKDSWGNYSTTGVYIFSHWSKHFLRVVVHFQRVSYENYNDDEDIVSC